MRCKIQIKNLQSEQKAFQKKLFSLNYTWGNGTRDYQDFAAARTDWSVMFFYLRENGSCDVGSFPKNFELSEMKELTLGEFLLFYPLSTFF